MAGIGFELRKHLRKETYIGLLTAYSIAAVVGSGPWVISIVGTILTGSFALARGAREVEVSIFLAVVTQTTALSLITSGSLQLVFTRFVADRLFEKKRDVVVPNLFGALLLATAVSSALGVALAVLVLKGTPLALRALTVTTFVTLNDVWLLSVFLTGMKAYRLVVTLFLAGYGASFGLANVLAGFGATGLLFAFFVGQGVLLTAMLVTIVREYPTGVRVAFDFLDRKQVFPVLVGTGILYNVGIWTDKVIFWTNPSTSSNVAGLLRSSVIYDVPIFLSYFSIVPGMAVFLVRIETDFAEQYDQFFDAVREGASLATIERLRDSMVGAARDGIYDLFRVQGMTVVFVILIGPRLLSWLGIPLLYVPLFDIDVVGTGIQVVFLGLLTVLFYLDYRTLSFGLNVLFCIANAVLTTLSIWAGSRYYGFGFAGSLLVTAVTGLGILSRKLSRLEYETFMR